MPDPTGPANADELRRYLESMIADMAPGDLPDLLSKLTGAGAADQSLPPDPRLRKEKLEQTVVFRVRVDLDGARPPIWRRLDLRSDISLLDVHRALQAAFGWLDYHLYRFALGGSPFHPRSELFLCPYDVEEGEDPGTPVADVRLDETLHEPGDVLRYVYDYGDSWELTLRVESVHDASDTTPAAWCVGGRRAAPPEDCGGLTDAESLSTVLDDPTHFHIDEVNAAFSNPIAQLLDAGGAVRLIELLYRLEPGRHSADLVARAARLVTPPTPVTTAQLDAALRPYLWFLQHARDHGFDLTSAGYLKPADVVAASEVLPSMHFWIGTKNREVQCAPLLEFRESLQRIKLLRKHKGRLLPTRMAHSIADDPDALADYLAATLLPDGMDRFTTEATLLLLFFAATADPADELPLETIAELLTDLDWRQPNRAPLRHSALYRLDSGAYELMQNVSAPVRGIKNVKVSPTAIDIARRALSR